jgi:hypothetical protein
VFSVGSLVAKTAAKAAHQQVRARERRRGERHERDKDREPDDQDRDHRELRNDQKEEHDPEDDAASDPFECVAHAIERPAAPALSVSDRPFDAAGAADPPDRAASESAFEPPQPATAPAVAAATTTDVVR